MNNNTPTTALTNAVSRKIFAPYFRGRRQNLENIVTDNALWTFAPPSYLTYYSAFIRQWLEWARGFVPMLHTKDFFSTGMGYTVCDILTKECMAGGYRFTATDPDTKAFINEWCKDDLNNIVNKTFFFANAGGNALLALYPIEGDLYPAVYPIDRCFFQIARNGKVTKAIILNRFVAGENSTFYARENRYLDKDGKAYWMVELYSQGSMVTSPTWSSGGSWSTVPKEIEAPFVHTYGDIQPNVWYELPEALKGIGVYNVKNKAVAVAIADLPGYSDSSLHTALDVLYSIDYNYTQGQVDQYLGKGRALVPKEMQPNYARAANGAPILDGMSYGEATAQAEMRAVPLDDTFYTQVSAASIDGKPISPTFMQPDLRGDVRKHIRDADLELLASKVGLSASTLAAHLAGSGTKTDDEVNAESSATEKTVFNKRGLASTAINAMMTDVAAFYGYVGKVSIQWGRTTSNSIRENRELLEDYTAGTISLLDYVKRRHPDMTEEEAEAFAERARADFEKRNTPQFEPMMNDFAPPDGDIPDEPLEDEEDTYGEA